MNHKPRSVACFRPAFTLVEMLVVITIIAILASLITVAANSALYSSKNTRIKVEVDQLGEKMELFKSKYGSYPPCNLQISASVDNPALRQFISKAWPRYDQSNLIADLQNSGVDTGNFRPDCALVFWLSGFSPDLSHPFTGPGGPGDTTGAARQPIAEFDQARLWPPNGTKTAAGVPLPQVYLPPYSGIPPYSATAAMPPPYVYFDYQNYGILPPAGTFAQASYAVGASGTVVPYVRDTNNNGVFDAGIDNWANPTSFQIICAGQDKSFGTSATMRLFPTGTGYDAGGADNDNITNFLSGVNCLENAKP